MAPAPSSSRAAPRFDMRRALALLNDAQRRAVTTVEGPLLVLAGAGTGKTRVVTHRIAYLLHEGVAPTAILAMTFTNKAAQEMRERVGAMVGAATAQELTVGTFHAFAIRSVRAHARLLGLPPNFVIADSSDQLGAIKSALRELHVPEKSLQPRAVHSRISLLKNRLVTADAFLDDARDDEDALIGRVYQKYDAHLRRSRALDFDDLLVQAVALLRDHSAALANFRARYTHLLVDEFQDTNAPQFEVVRRIAGERRNVCAVGDDDQSIYGWRGADVSKILDFGRHFPGAEIVRLETNYRSTSPIVEAANHVIARNADRHEKTLVSHAGSGEPVEIAACEDEEREADRVVFDIVGKVARRGLGYGDFAVLFRTAPQARAFEALFRQEQVPYVLVGGQSFFDRKEVRDLLAFVKLAVNPLDETALLRVVNTPPRGVGKTTIDALLSRATAAGVSVPQLLDAGGGLGDLPRPAIEAVRSLRSRLAEWARPPGSLVERLRRIVDGVDYEAELTRLYPDPETRAARAAAVGEFLNMAENHQRRRKSATLAGFLEDVTVTAEDTRDREDKRAKESVTLMTLHAAKGLEFSHVYLVGMEEGVLPHARAGDDGIAEERRLAYVGITRARRRLTLTFAKTRSRFGRRRPTVPSRFLWELRGQSTPDGWQPTLPEPETAAGKRRGGRKGRGGARRPRTSQRRR